ncbi:uncharacterized protein LOC144654687 isoform X2 [Oculina patagonica]
MGSKAKKDRKIADILDDDELDIDKKASKIAKQGEVKGLLSSIIADELKGSSRPPSPASFSLEGRKPAEIFRTDLISAMKLPDHQNLSPENYITITDQWRQEWERGVQVPVNPEGVFQPSFRPVEPLYKRAGNFKQPNKLLSTPSKARGRPPASKCPYDLGRMDVEWLTSLNKSRQGKGLMELEETQLEKALAYIENKCYDNMGHAIATQEGLSIEYDEDVCCDVCQSPDSEESNEMVFCDVCDICVHQACYGIQNIPAGSWLCHPCRKGIKNCQCELCPLSGGAMKRTKNGKGWVHVSCALWIPEVGFGSIPKMEPVTRIENIPASRWNLVCSLCREKVGACIQCTVKSCVTAFHVTCGFKHVLEMRTVLDDSATDGVRHISYCTKHSHKSKSPNKKTKEETSTSAEDAENLRQKRLKQMEEEFFKFVSPAEIAKDLNLPKELATKIHKFWALKRKAQDDVPLLPPTLQQQEKLSGKQGAVNSSSNLQVQLERIVKLRCNLEKLRNLCYMVTKREKMRRELYRAREEVFWQEHAVMTDETCDMDEEAVQWVLTMCKDNFCGDGSFPAAGKDGGCGSLAGSLYSRVSSTVESSSTTSSSGDCSSTEQNSGGGEGGDSDTKSRGEAADEEETRDSNEEEVLVSTPARRTRRNSHLVTQSSLCGQSVDSVAGSSKEPESAVTSDSETPSRKRTRTKTQSFSESSATTPKRVLRNTITELKETPVEHNSLEQSSSEKPRRRRTRHLSLPNAVKETREESDKETVGTSEEGGQNSDAVFRETRTRLSRTGKLSKNLETAETGSEGNSSEKPEVDEKESRKENDPLRPENMVERERTGNTTKGVKRKRSKSTTAVDDNMRNKQARITDYLRRKSPNRKELRSLKSPRTRANRKNSESEESDQVRAVDTDIDTNSKRGPTPRSFSNGRETTSDNLCPHCKLQHDKLSKCSWRCKEGSHTAECEDNWNRRELRVRTGFQSPKSRARCSHVVSSKPHCCSSLMSKFCHATVT